MHAILTHFHLDSISHSGFDAIAMLPECNQSLGRFSRQLKTGESLEHLSISARRLYSAFTAQPQCSIGFIPGPRSPSTDCGKTRSAPRLRIPQTHRLRMLKTAESEHRQSLAIRVLRNCLWPHLKWPSEKMAAYRCPKNSRLHRPRKSQV